MSLREIGQRPLVFAKVSEVLRRVSGQVRHDLAFYRARLDELWDIFGENSLMYGSDWPNSDQWAPYSTVFRLVQEYFAGKSPTDAYRELMRVWPGHYRPPQIADLFMQGGMATPSRTALVQSIHSVLKRERQRMSRNGN